MSDQITPTNSLPERWHMKKEIQLGHLITTLAVAFSCVLYVSRIEQRISVIETQISSQRESATLLRAQLEKINDKLDRLIERDRK